MPSFKSTNWIELRQATDGSAIQHNLMVGYCNALEDLLLIVLLAFYKKKNVIMNKQITNKTHIHVCTYTRSEWATFFFSRAAYSFFQLATNCLMHLIAVVNNALHLEGTVYRNVCNVYPLGNVANLFAIRIVHTCDWFICSAIDQRSIHASNTLISSILK